MLQAFFDETGGDETKDLTAVAGFVYDKAGLTEFTNAWVPQVQDLSGPYRTSPCNAVKAPFSPPDWPEWRCQNLIDNLATLSADHALAGFVVATRKCDFEDALENGPGIAKLIDSPYALCLMGVLSVLSHRISEIAPGMKVYCRFEDGACHRKETQELVGRLRSNPDTQADFSNIAGCIWEPKSGVPAFCSADLLAWEWQRNVLRSPNQWTPRMNDLNKRMREHSKLIFADHITGSWATLWALSNVFPELRRD